MHVDGFRFDLASVLSRDIHGKPQANPPILWDIETDPVLSGTKLIAEAWDAAGLYQVGNFFGDHWKEWNGRFRDDVRAFVKGDQGHAGTFAKRFLGQPRHLRPPQSRARAEHQFRDLPRRLHDERSGFVQRESTTGPTTKRIAMATTKTSAGIAVSRVRRDDPEIERLRLKQIKNLFTINVLAFGVPMILMGDEVRRTQNGNNNAYCQDNEISWLDWNLVKQNAGLHAVRQAIDRVSPRIAGSA